MSRWREKREQPLAAISVETAIASNGLWRMMTSAVPNPTQPLWPPASAATAAASATPPEQRVKRHAYRGRRPRKLAGGLFSQSVGGQAVFSAHLVAVRELFAGVPVFGRSFRYVVMVVGEKPLEEEHRQKAAQGQTHRLVHRMILVKGVRHEMQQRHAEHQPGNKADRYLQPRMGEPHGQQQPAARQRGQQHQRAVDAQATADDGVIQGKFVHAGCLLKAYVNWPVVKSTSVQAWTTSLPRWRSWSASSGFSVPGLKMKRRAPLFSSSSAMGSWLRGDR